MEDDHIVDPALVDLFDSLLEGRAQTPRLPGAFDTAIWSDLESAGLTRLTGTAESGSGAGWIEAAALLRAAAYHGVQLPIAENDLLGGWLSERAKLPDASHLRTSARIDSEGWARAVPWGRHAASVVLLQESDGDWFVRELEVQAGAVEQDENLAGEPRDSIRFDLSSGSAHPIDATVAAEWQLRGALARAIQISGALRRTVDIALQYAAERQQFGRPIGAFQAVQHLAATMASETSLVLAATDSAAIAAAETDDWSDPQLQFDIAVAKSTASAAASVVTRAAHQMLGAIGTTAEHALHTATLPSLAWANEFGTADSWNERIRAAVADASEESSLWSFITRVHPTVR